MMIGYITYRLIDKTIAKPLYSPNSTVIRLCNTVNPQFIMPDSVYLLHTGVFVKVPNGYELHIRNAMYGFPLAVTESYLYPGFGGEICVQIVNYSDRRMTISSNEHVADLKIVAIGPTVPFIQVE